MFIEDIVKSCIDSILEENSELLTYAANNAPLSEAESAAINKRLDKLEEILDGVKLLVEDAKHCNQNLLKAEEDHRISKEEYNAFFKRINMDL